LESRCSTASGAQSANTTSPANISNRRPLGGGLVKAQWFQRYRDNELPRRFDPRRTELGYNQQSERTERFLGMHNLGNKR
jgi:hypothetical protein